MKVPLSKELIEYLAKEDYTFLVAERKENRDWFIFEPVYGEISMFVIRSGFAIDNHVILAISEILQSFLYEDYLNHEVLIPVNMR